MSNTIDLKINVVILEDEKDILDDLTFEMNASLKNFNEDCRNPEMEIQEVGLVNLIPHVQSFDNLKSTRTQVHNGNCDLLIADFRVKEFPQSHKATATVLPLLREIKNKNGFIPVIGHTAFSEMYSGAKEDNLTYQTYSKTERESILKIIQDGVFITKEIGRFKRDLFTAFSEIHLANETSSLVDRQQNIEGARNILANIEVPKYAPFDYKKTVVMLRSLFFRLSSIPSDIFQLNSLNSEFIQILKKLTMELKNPFYSFEKNGIPLFMELEAKGYNVIMKINDNDF